MITSSPILSYVHEFDLNSHFTLSKFHKVKLNDGDVFGVNNDDFKLPSTDERPELLGQKYLISQISFDELWGALRPIVNGGIYPRELCSTPPCFIINIGQSQIKHIPLSLFYMCKTFIIDSIKYFVYKFPLSFTILCSHLAFHGVMYNISEFIFPSIEMYVVNDLNPIVPLNERFPYTTQNHIDIYGSEPVLTNQISNLQLDFLWLIGIYITGISDNFNSFELMTPHHNIFVPDYDCIKDEFGIFVPLFPMDKNRISLSPPQLPREQQLQRQLELPPLTYLENIEKYIDKYDKNVTTLQYNFIATVDEVSYPFGYIFLSRFDRGQIQYCINSKIICKCKIHTCCLNVFKTAHGVGGNGFV